MLEFAGLMALALFVAPGEAAILTLFNFNDMNELGNGTTVATKDNVLGVPSLTMVENGGALAAPTGVTGAAFNDADGDSHVADRAAGWASTTGGSSWLLDLNTTGYSGLSLRFDVRSTAGAAATGVTIGWAVNGGSFTDLAPLALTQSTSFHPYTVDLSTLAAIDDAASVQLRGVWSTDGTGPNTRLDNVQLTGTVIPEPSTVLLCSLGAIGATLLLIRRRPVARPSAFPAPERKAWPHRKWTFAAVAMMLVLSAKPCEAKILALFNFNDMNSIDLSNGTTIVSKENVPGVPTLSMVENDITPMTNVTGVTGVAFTDEDGQMHSSGRSSGWISTTINSYWVMDLSTLGYIDLSLRFDNRSSGTSPPTSAGATSITVAWAVDGGAFTDVTTVTLNQNAAFSPYSVDLTAIDAIEDKPSVQIRGLWGTDGTGPNTRLDNLQLTGTALAVEGDYNENGVVDAGDYVVWRKGIAPLPNEVAEPLGITDEEDYKAWRARFGNPSSGGGAGTATSAAPEPSTAALVCASAIGVILARGRRRFV
jgi:hypothetical protein